VSISIPIPKDLTKHERDLWQTLHEICRRALDVSINPAQVPVSLEFSNAGTGIIWADGTTTNTAPSGTTTVGQTAYAYSRDQTLVYSLLVESDGALSVNLIGPAIPGYNTFIYSRSGLIRYTLVVEADGALSVDPT
jgi:hypothetical protein